MAGRIPQHFIDDLINKVDIVDVVDSRVALKKRGKEYIACCPFHNEKSPSFTVSQNKQFYHCFGCGAHGTALSFVMEYERLEFIDAVEALAADYHMEVPREQGNFNPQKTDDKKAIYEILDQTSQLYQQQIKPNQKAIDYLKGRGLSGDITKKFGIGYSIDSWDFILQKLGQTPQQKQTLLKSGLTIEKSADKHYDRFRDRIMFPIRDRRGRVIGFGGRILDQGEPKYLNSPETPVFHKGQELYGLYEARQAVRELKHLVIVEGYMDVVALAQHGVPYTVATLGTACSDEQIKQLFRIVPELIFCFDGDAAGKKAAWRALENTLGVIRDGVQARFLFLPDGEDPDSMIRLEGQQAFEQRLHNATPLSEFMLDHLADQVDLTSMDGRARFSESTKPLISKLTDGVFKQLLTQQISKRVGLSVSAMQHHLPDNASPQVQHKKNSNQQDRYKITNTPARLAIGLLLQYPECSKQLQFPEHLLHSDIPGITLLYKLHQTILQTENTSPSVLLERWRDTAEEASLIKMMQWDIPGVDEEEQRINLLQDAIKQLSERYREQRLEGLLLKSENESLTPEEKTELSGLYTSQN
jgi:DNA primase